MHLILLGLILVIGILVYYIMTTGAGDKGASSGKKKDSGKSGVSDNLRKEDNVIFLPTADGAKETDSKDPASGSDDTAE